MEGKSIKGRSLESVGLYRKISLNACPFLGSLSVLVIQAAIRGRLIGCDGVYPSQYSCSSNALHLTALEMEFVS